MINRLMEIIESFFYFIRGIFQGIEDQFIASSSQPFQVKQDLVGDVLRGIPIIGYLMATISIIDCIYMVIPPQLQNPAWELTAIGAVANHTWGIVFGFGFMLTAFSFETIDRVKPIEIHIINLFRIVLILLALLFILAMPLVVVNTLRVNKSEAQQITNQAKARENIITQLEGNLSAITDVRQLLEIAQGLELNLALTPQSTADSLKQEIREKLPETKVKVKEEAEKAITSRQNDQWKKSARTFIQLFIFSVANIILWFKTRGLKRLIE